MEIKDLLKDAYKEGMTLEDVVEALKGIDLPIDNSAEIDRLKNALTKSNSEAADYKKQLREKMSADEKKAKDDADMMSELQSKYDDLLRKTTISENKVRLLSLGYDDALANDVAEAMVNGDTDKVFDAQKKHLNSLEKRIREEVLKNTPKPDGGNSSPTVTKETFSKMSLAEQYEFSKSHPEEYKQLYGGN